jgi:hypothetical protein
MEDARDLAFSLFNAGAIGKASLLEMVEPPMKDRLVEEVKAMEATAAMQQVMQMSAPPEGGAPAGGALAGGAPEQPEQPQLRAV